MIARDDQQLERVLGRVLGTGVIISSVCLLLGLVLSFAQVWPDAAILLLRAGLIVLMMTPMARVVASAITYVIERDWMFAALTTAVFLELAASVVAALVFNRRL